jgi:hypothetical protein
MSFKVWASFWMNLPRQLVIALRGKSKARCATVLYPQSFQIQKPSPMPLSLAQVYRVRQ